jgi:hypothetical protein
VLTRYSDLHFIWFNSDVFAIVFCKYFITYDSRYFFCQTICPTQVYYGISPTLVMEGAKNIPRGCCSKLISAPLENYTPLILMEKLWIPPKNRHISYCDLMFIPDENLFTYVNHLFPLNKIHLSLLLFIGV